MHMDKIHKNLFCLILLSISGCSQNSALWAQMFASTFQSPDDFFISNEKVNEIPYASIYVHLEGGANTILILGNASAPLNPAENQSNYQLKWYSSDNEMIITESGRVIKTVNLSNKNLTSSYSKDPDPLSLNVLKPETPKTWIRYINWREPAERPDLTPTLYSDYKLQSQFYIQGRQVININGNEISTIYVTEEVTAPQLSTSYTNQYWLSPDSGLVLASNQKIAPTMPYIELQLLKAFSGELQ